MKKLLTVLLTLVMAVCLINLNNSHTKAEDTNADPVESTYLKAGVQIYQIINPLSYRSDIKHFKFCANKPDGITGTEYDISLDTDGTAMLGYNSTNNTLYVYGAKKYIFHASCVSMFSEMSGLVDIDFNNMIDTSNVNDFSSMFYNDHSLDTLDLSCFSKPVFKGETLRTTDMFKTCMNLKTIFVKKDGFDMSNITSGNSAGAFDGCSKLIGGNGTKFNSSYKDKTYGLIDKEGQAGYFTDIDNGPIYCFNGIRFSDEGSGPKWYDGDKEFITTSTSSNIFGISYDSATNTAHFSKSLSYSSNAAPYTFVIANTSLSIVLDSDISINNTSTATGTGCIMIQNADVELNGVSGHTLKISTLDKSALFVNTGKITLKNINLVFENKSQYNATVRTTGNLTLEGNCNAEIINSYQTPSANEAMALQIGGNLTIPNGSIVGSETGKGISEGPVEKAGATNIYVLVDGTPNTPARYIRIANKQIPTPSPSPSKKDESCEKVIGPTWHWNNTKGICEDYGVVGTATR